MAHLEFPFGKATLGLDLPDARLRAVLTSGLHAYTPEADGETLVRRGTCEGKILHAYRGEGGFGYDPLFESETGKTFAEMPLEEKNVISHRRRGIEALLHALEEEE